ncbi:carboxylate--amine ligase [Haloferacaceae archaeon DSL9]
MTTGDAVVIPAISAGSSLAFVRSLGRKGIETIMVSPDRSAPPLRSKYCSAHVTAPDPMEDLRGYTNVLLKLAARPEVRTIVPLRETDIYVLSRNREAFAEHIATPWPPAETVASVQDRSRLIDLANEIGVAAPKSAPLTEWDDWSEPRVLKPRYSLCVDDSDDVHVPAVQFTSAGEPPDVDAVISQMGHEPLVQEVIPGDAEHGFFALFDEGTPIATFQHRRVRSFKYSGGASVFRKAVKIPAMQRDGLALLEALDWHGPAMVEFKRDPRTDRFVLIEINPRFWGSLRLAVHAGVDFPHRYYQLATGERNPEPSEYRAGVGCHLLRGELVYLHSVLTEEYDHVDPPRFSTELRRIAASIATNPHFDYFDWNDPKPLVRDITNHIPRIELTRRKWNSKRKDLV